MAKKEQKKVKKEVETLIDTPKVTVGTPVSIENEMPGQVEPKTEPLVSGVKADAPKDAILTSEDTKNENTPQMAPEQSPVTPEANDFTGLKPLGEQMMNLLSVESAIGLVCEKYERCIDTVRGTSVIPGAMEQFLKYNQMRIKFIDKIEKLIDKDKWIKDFLKN